MRERGGEGGREAGTKIYGSFTNDATVGRGFLRSVVALVAGWRGREEAASKLGPMSNSGDELVSWCGGVSARNQRARHSALVGHSATLLGHPPWSTCIVALIQQGEEDNELWT